MRYLRIADKAQAERIIESPIDSFGNISRTGSVAGMRQQYGWEAMGQVRMGAYIYNIGRQNVNKLREASLVHE